MLRMLESHMSHEEKNALFFLPVFPSCVSYLPIQGVNCQCTTAFNIVLIHPSGDAKLPFHDFRWFPILHHVPLNKADVPLINYIFN